MAPMTSGAAVTNRLRSLDEALKVDECSTEILSPTAEGGAIKSPSTAPMFVSKLVRNSNGLVARTVGEWLFAFWAYRVARQRRPQFLLVSVPFVPLAALVVRASRWRRRRPQAILLDVRDLTWEYAMAEKPESRLASLVGNGYGRLIGSAARSADLVSCVTSAQCEAVQHLGGGVLPVLAPNGISNAMRESLRMPQPIGRTGAYRVLYAGNIGRAQDVPKLLDLARLRSDITLRIAGDGPQTDELEAALIKVPNASYIGRLTPDELRQEYEWADVLVACLRTDDAFRSAVPSKLYEYSSTGRLVVFVGEGAGAEEAARLGGLAMSAITEAAVTAMVDLVERARLHGVPHSTAELPTRENIADDLVRHLMGAGRGI